MQDPSDAKCYQKRIKIWHIIDMLSILSKSKVQGLPGRVVDKAPGAKKKCKQ